MKRNTLTLILLLSGALVGCGESTPEKRSSEPVALTVTLAPIDSEQGVLYVQLNNANQAVESQWRFASQASEPFIFEGVSPGEYSVFAFHDLNGDKQLSFKDNIPAEPVGYSNNPTLRGEPSFGLVSFDLHTNQTLELTLFRYP